MAIEISYYDVRLDSLSKWELEWFRWWFVQVVYNDTGKLHSNEFNTLLFTFRPSLTKTELPCLLCGCSATSVIPGIFGLSWSLVRCVSWRHKRWKCCILHNSDSMDALLADRPSTFADITVIAPEGL